MRLQAAGQTDIGCVRSSNQDAIDWLIDSASDQALLIVADGMGGYQGGEVASRIAVDTVMELLGPAIKKADPESQKVSREQLMQSALDQASERIEARKRQEPNLDKMGTTIVIAWVHGQQASLAHIGDSRCYRYRNGGLTCLTRDDTVVQNMLEDGSIREEEVPNVPFRNVLTRALGASDATATLAEVTLEPGDRLLLCSDGLTGALDEEFWPAVIDRSASVHLAVRALVTESLEKQAKDNVSVVLLAAD